MTLLEKYQRRIAAGEHRYMESHQGKEMPKFKKVILAKLLENTNRVLTESFENSVGTQRSDMGAFKKFALTLVNAAVPDLIATDLVITYPKLSWGRH